MMQNLHKSSIFGVLILVTATLRTGIIPVFAHRRTISTINIVSTRSLLPKDRRQEVQRFVGLNGDLSQQSTAILELRGGAYNNDNNHFMPSLAPTSTPSSITNDFGAYLSTHYNVNVAHSDDDASSNSRISVLAGNLLGALEHARSQGRLLVVYIPADKKTSSINDQIAIKSLLSAEVAKVAKKKAFKSATTRSFALWSCKAGSSEATAAIKRLKVVDKYPTGSGKRPILAVVYLARSVDKQGRPRSVPKLLAQHHCSPPPSAANMAAWLDALRKRHVKLYKVMQKELLEIGYHEERKKGYKQSIQDDIDRRELEDREKAERLAREQAERERREAILARRAYLLDRLPTEPDTSAENTKTIALRFGNGQSGQRRFRGDESLESVFNWIDAVYKIERENLVLTTMNGQKTFKWEDDDREQSLSEAGLARMVGLRVTVIKKDDDNNNKEKTNIDSQEE